MKNPHWIGRAEFVARGLCQRSWLVLFLCLLTAAGGLWLAFDRLSLSTDRSHMLDPSLAVSRAWRESRRTFGTPDDCIVLLQGETVEKGREGIEQLSGFLDGDEEFFEKPLYRLDLPQVRDASLYFLSVEGLKELCGVLDQSLPWLSGKNRPGLQALLDEFQKAPERPSFRAQLQMAVPLLNRVLEQLARSLESRGQSSYHSPMGDPIPDLDMLRANQVRPGQTTFYSLLADGKTFVLFVRPRHRHSFEQAERNLERLRSWVGVVQRSHPSLAIFLSGEPVLYTDELLGVRRDLLQAGALSVLLVSSLVTMALASMWRAAAVAACLSVGMSWSLGAAALLVPRLDLITVSCFAFIGGVNLTLAVLVAYRYQWERSRSDRTGCQPCQAMGKTMGDLGLSMLLGSGFCATSCMLLQLSSLRVLRQFGLLGAAGILLATLSALVFLPALLHRLDGVEPRLGAPRGALIALVPSLLPGKARILCVATLSLVSAVGLTRLTVDYSLLNLHAQNSESYQVEEFLRGRGYSNLFAVSIAPNLEAARKRQARLSSLSSVSRVESIVGLLPVQVEEKQPWIDRLVAQAGQLPLPPLPERRSADELLKLFASYQACEKILREALPQAEEMMALLDRLQTSLVVNNPGPVEAGLTAFEVHFCEDLRNQIQLLKSQKNIPPDLPRLLPQGLLARSLSPQGTVLMRIFPSGDCWQQDNLRRFVEQMQTIDPDVTGNPVLMLVFTDELQASLGTWAFSVISACLLWMLLWRRTWRQIAGTFLVAGTASFWTFGLIGALDTPLNVLTLLALPLLLCLGLGFASQGMVTRWRHHRSAPHTSPPSFVAGLAWVLGSSCLLGANHRGLASLGVVVSLVVGMHLISLLLLAPPVAERCGEVG